MLVRRDVVELAPQPVAYLLRRNPFSKCSILLMDLSQRGEVTADLFTPNSRPGAEKLMTVIDSINEREGRGAVRLAGCRRRRSGPCDVTC